jgi:chromate transporter
MPTPSAARRIGTVFVVALQLGLTSFGGPIAHLGYFHREYVERRRWLTERAYLDLVALCQVLPGPASSQVGIAIGLLRAGPAGALAAWAGFTLPSAVLLTAFALLTTDVDLAGAGWVHGLKLAAIAIVAIAIGSMWRSLAPDAPRRVIVVVAAAIMLLLPGAALQVVVIAAGALAGWLLLRGSPDNEGEVTAPSPVGRRAGIAALVAFFTLLLGLPVLHAVTGSEMIALLESLYRAGALVFGGGHVVLPLLNEAVVAPSWVGEEQFLAGYGAAQAVPGPLFTIGAYVGAVAEIGPGGLTGAAIGLVAIFVPSFLLVVAAMPFWIELRRSDAFRAAMAGTGAAVIGLLVAALWDPLWTGTVRSWIDVALASGALGALLVRTPPLIVVGSLALTAQALRWAGVG